MGEVVSMHQVTGDSTYTTPRQMLEEMLADEEGVIDAVPKAMLIVLDDGGGEYSYGFRAAGLAKSEAIALLRVVSGLLEEALR